MDSARSSVRRSTWRGSPSYGSRLGVTMSQNMRATPLSSGRHGRTLKVTGSGIAIMSDSSIALKPVMDEPSKPMPPSKASSSSSALIEKLFSWPRMSVNQRRTKRMPRSSTNDLISSAVRGGWSAMGLDSFGGWAGGLGARKANQLQPGARPGLQRPDGGLERAALLGQRVLHADRHVVDHAALDNALGLELLEALGQEPVREIGHQELHLGEAQRTIQEHEQDGAGPALPDQLDRPVIRGAARLPSGSDRMVFRSGLLGSHGQHRSALSRE